LNFSLGDEDARTHYHTGLQVGERKHHGFGFFSGNDIVINAGNNLEDGGVNDFAKKTVLLERSFLSWMGTILPDTHIALSGGYLEDAFAGLGGEVLYRPHQSPFSIGIDAWRVLARAPDTPLGLGLFDGAAMTGHITLGYEFPNSNLTAFTKFGRYLYGDDGVTLGLEKKFDGGAKLKTFLSATNQRDRDSDGRKQGYYGGIELSLPLGHFDFGPLETNLKMKSAPFSRVYGQILDKPISLYDLTEPMSYRHLGQNWQGVQKNHGIADALP